MRFMLSYAPANGGAERLTEGHATLPAALKRACALIETDEYRQFEIRDQEQERVLEEPLIRRHCQGEMGLVERME